jgi:hypothetical protein
MWAAFAIFKKRPKVNNRPMEENSPNLVALPATNIVINFVQKTLKACGCCFKDFQRRTELFRLVKVFSYIKPVLIKKVRFRHQGLDFW